MISPMLGCTTNSSPPRHSTGASASGCFDVTRRRTTRGGTAGAGAARLRFRAAFVTTMAHHRGLYWAIQMFTSLVLGEKTHGFCINDGSKPTYQKPHHWGINIHLL